MGAVSYIGVTVILIIAVLFVAVYAYNHRPSKNDIIITPKENEKFMADSIAIQPSNRRIFENQSTDDIIESGLEAMKNENYRMLEGVNKDGI